MLNSLCQSRVQFIPSEMLPAIVVTPDFCSEQFVWFRTCPAHVEEQLKTLGYLAERAGRVFIGEDPYSHIFAMLSEGRLDLCAGRGRRAVQGSLARALTEVLSFIIAGNGRDSWLQTRALNQVGGTIRELHNDLTRLKWRSEGDGAEEVDDLCVTIASFLAQLNSKPDPDLGEFVAIDERYLEGDSYRILRTAHRVFDLLTSKDLGREMSAFRDSFLDHSPGIICLAKVFEKEINLSVVHWIRKELGISLPEYFNKPQPRVRAEFSPVKGGKKIDFNTERSGKWIPPGIGQSEIVCKEMSSSAIREYFSRGWFRSNWDLLLTRWQEIRKERNSAAHTEVATIQSLLAVRDALGDLSKHGIFEVLYRMKMEYRGSYRESR